MSLHSMIDELNKMVVTSRMPAKRAGRIIAELLIADAKAELLHQKLAVEQDLRALNIPTTDSPLKLTQALIAAVKDARAESRRLDQLAILMFRVCEEGMAALEGIRDEDLCVGSLQAVIRLRRARDRAEGDNASHEKRLDACYRAARGEDWKAELGELMPGQAVEAVVELQGQYEVERSRQYDELAEKTPQPVDPATAEEKKKEFEELLRRTAVIPIEAGRLVGAAANVPGPRHTVILPDGHPLRAGDEVTLVDGDGAKWTVTGVFAEVDGPYAKISRDNSEQVIACDCIKTVFPEIPF